MPHSRPIGDQLAGLRVRLAGVAALDTPRGLTDPDPDTPEERWDAGQVWAHIAEFVGYWHAQLATVVRLYDGGPVPFGRVKTDAGRINSIEVGRHRPIRDLAAEADRELAALQAYLATLDDDAWQARGLHPTRGVMDVPAMVKRFISDHLEEHVVQLDGLAKSAER